MAPPVEISIPSTTLSSTPKPYTLYNITLRLPLRTYIVPKRYSEFNTLHLALTSAAGNVAPPASLPGKSWYKLTSTINSPDLTEERRLGLEKYLKTIAESKDSRWRDTSVWRSFLNLPSTAAIRDDRRDSAHAAITRNGGTELSDPTAWLDVHREMKGLLHEARLQLERRDSAGTAAGQHEAGANAKRCLVKAGCLLANLEEGLRVMSEGSKRSAAGAWGRSAAIGVGELRRRKDLLGSAKVEKEGLEKLSATLALKGNQNYSMANSGNGAVATQQDKNPLFGLKVAQPRTGRVLGVPVPETNRTRELDNEGVLMLQKQMMQEQDLDVEELAKIVRRQREMGVSIHEELEEQNEILKRLDVDVTRVQGKIEVAKKRVGKIS